MEVVYKAGTYAVAALSPVPPIACTIGLGHTEKSFSFTLVKDMDRVRSPLRSSLVFFFMLLPSVFIS